MDMAASGTCGRRYRDCRRRADAKRL